ncbi:MAG: Cna B-type domain-containing protein [Ruminococcaceae bacterium]|nr:Cna B-type domain-containing protein [Oscillospiraceae bacterium]
MRKFFATLLALVMVLSLMVPTAWAAEEKSDDIVILYTNDIHTYIDKDMNYDALSLLKENLESKYNNVLLVDAGDHIQGTAYGSMDKGKTIIDLMNAAGYDLATLGNHEFDYGQQGRINVTDSWAGFPYVSCNFYNEKDGVVGDSVLDAYKVFETAGKKIALIGITTPESFTKSTPAYFQDGAGKYIYGIAGGTDGKALYAAVQKAVDAASAEADVVIALGHLGDDPASQPWTSEEVIANTTGLDAFIDGHSHSTVIGKAVKDKGGNDVVLTQTGEYFGAVGMMVIDAETGAITTDLIKATGLNADGVRPQDSNKKLIYADVVGYKFEAVNGDYSYTCDAGSAAKTIQDAWVNSVDEQLGVKIGETALTFDNYDADNKRLVRKQQTNTGAFAADALYYLFDNMDLDVDVAIMNGGGVRNKAVTGDLTYKTAKTIHTFGNVACLQTITGQQLLDALEWGAKATPAAENGGFLHVAGVTYKIATNIPSTVQADDKGVWTGAPTGAYRVYDVMVYDKATNEYVPLDLDAKYNLAGYNYTLRDLGDGFAMFDGAVNVLDYVMEDYMVLANYIQAFPKGESGYPVVDAANSPLLAKYNGMNIDYGSVTGYDRISNLDGVALTIEKEWAKDEAKNRPESITVNILCDGEKCQEVVLTAAEDWRAVLTLNLYAGEYTVEEVAVKGYKSEVKTEVIAADGVGIDMADIDDNQTEVKSSVNAGDVLLLLQVNNADVSDNSEVNNAKLIAWAADAAMVEELQTALNVVIDALEFEGIELAVIAGEQALKDLGGVYADGKWNFVATQADDIANGVVAVLALNSLPTEVEVTITNTKEAPKTGDAGVAIYMVLAMMAVCGGAVLVSKKRAFN